MKLKNFIIEQNERKGDRNISIFGVNNQTGIDTSKDVSKNTTNYKVICYNYFAYNPYRINVGSIGLFKGKVGGVSPAYVVFSVDEKKLNPDFLFIFLKSSLGNSEINKYTFGAVRKSLSYKNLGNIEIPDLSLEEQKLFLKYYDKINESYSELNKVNTKNLNYIKQLKQSILQEAIEGKLTQSWRENHKDVEPASILLKRIKKEKEELIKKGELKKQKPLKEIIPEEIPFKIPETWSWCRLGEIINISSGKGLTSANMNKNGNIPVFGGNGITGYHDQYNTEEETIVIGRVGFYCGSIHLTPKMAWITDNAFFTSFSENNIFKDFLILLLKGTNLKEKENAGAQPVISGTKIYPIIVSLPPLEEQKEIAKKVEEYMKLCDELEAQTMEAKANTENLMKSILAEVFTEKAKKINNI